jgi:hypothetical protein
MDQDNNVTIRLGNGVEFHRAEERVREYCSVEVYRDKNYVGGYDDRHNVTDSITREDLEAANNLYARIGQLDSKRILGNPEIPGLLAALEDIDLGTIGDEEWDRVRASVRPLIAAFVSISNVKLAKTMKVLHLKRPRLLPILDSYVVRFLTGNNMIENQFSQEEILKIGMDSLELSRKDIAANRSAFAALQSRLSDLPTPLTVVRMYDILCWTQEKWVVRGDTGAPFGVASRSLNQAAPSSEHPKGAGISAAADATKGPVREAPKGEISTTKEFRRIQMRAEGVIVNTASSPPRAHRPLCLEVTEEGFQTTVILNEGRSGRYYLRENLAEAAKDFGAVACKKCRPERPVKRT